MIIDDVRQWIEKNVDLYATPIYTDIIPIDDSRAVMIRRDPGTATEQRYLDKSKTGIFNFALYCRSNDLQEAAEQINIFVQELDLSALKLNDVVKIWVAPVTGAVFVSKSGNGDYLYTASFELQYFKEGL